MEKGFVLKSTEDFAMVLDRQLKVVVWQSGKIVNYGGPIQLQTDEAVIITDKKYTKSDYEFRIR